MLLLSVIVVGTVVGSICQEVSRRVPTLSNMAEYQRKAIAFTVGEDAIRIVKEGTVYGSLIQMPNGVTYDFADLVSDLWILPSLLQ